MEKKITSGIMLTLLLISMVALAFNLTLARAGNDPEFKSFNIDIGRRYASGAAVTPDSKTIYVMNYDPTISVIDAAQDSFVKLIDLSAFNPWSLSGGVVVNDKLYAVGDMKVIIMDTTTEQVVETIPQSISGGYVWGRAVVSPAKDMVYTVFGSANTMLAIDTSTFQLHGWVYIGNENTGIGVSPSGHRIYVSDIVDGRLTIIDAQNLAVIAKKPFTSALISYYTTAIAVGADGSVYVGYVNTGWGFSIAVLDPDGNLIDTITTSGWSTGLEISKDGKYLVTGAGTIIDVNTKNIVAQVSTGIGEYQVNMSPDGRRAYITNYNSDYVTVVEGFAIPAVPATVNFDPGSLNLKSKGKWITLYIQLPEGYNPGDIDASTILLNGTIQPVLDPKYGFVTNSSEYLVDHNNDGIIERMVKFNRTQVAEYLLSKGIMHGNVTLTITGQLFDGALFEGSDIIRVRMFGDVDCNGKVDIFDIALAAVIYEESNPEPRCDLNEDGKIDILDIVIVAANYGKIYG